MRLWLSGRMSAKFKVRRLPNPSTRVGTHRATRCARLGVEAAGLAAGRTLVRGRVPRRCHWHPRRPRAQRVVGEPAGRRTRAGLRPPAPSGARREREPARARAPDPARERAGRRPAPARRALGRATAGGLPRGVGYRPQLLQRPEPEPRDGPRPHHDRRPPLAPGPPPTERGRRPRRASHVRRGAAEHLAAVLHRRDRPPRPGRGGCGAGCRRRRP